MKRLEPTHLAALTAAFSLAVLGAVVLVSGDGESESPAAIDDAGTEPAPLKPEHRVDSEKYTVAVLTAIADAGLDRDKVADLLSEPIAPRMVGRTSVNVP